MELSGEDYKRFQRHVLSSTAITQAPTTIMLGLLELVGPVEPIASVVEVLNGTEDSDGNDITTWRAAWLTENRLAFVEATKRTDRWDAFNERFDDGNPDVHGWVVPRSQIAGVTLSQLSVSRQRFGPEFVSSGKWSIEAQSRTLTLPLFDADPSINDNHRKAIEVFVAELPKS